MKNYIHSREPTMQLNSELENKSKKEQDILIPEFTFGVGLSLSQDSTLVYKLQREAELCLQYQENQAISLKSFLDTKSMRKVLALDAVKKLI